MTYFTSFLFQVSDSAIELALSILQTIDAVTLPSISRDSVVPTQEEMNNGKKALEINNESNLQ